MGVRCNDKLGHREGTFGEIPNSAISALIIRFISPLRGERRFLTSLRDTILSHHAASFQ